MKKTIRLTESDLHRLVKESVKRILSEGNWADGTPQQMAYHVATIGAMEDQEDADLAYTLYDKLSHNEIDVAQAIEFVKQNGYEDGASEAEPIPQLGHNFGQAGNEVLIYDTYTGAFDVFELV